MKIPITEIFTSIQGEGVSVGKPATFVRVWGCNLKCSFCDTKYIFDLKERKEVSIIKIVEEIKKYPITFVVLTGGEPLLYQEKWVVFFRYFPERYKFEIETNGTIWPLPLSLKHEIRYNVSPKLESSGNLKILRYKPDVLEQFRKLNSIFKFVVKTEKDWEEAEEIIKKIKIPKEKVWIMPEGVTDEVLKKRSQWLIPKIIEKGYNFSPRLQIWLYGNVRGK